MDQKIVVLLDKANISETDIFDACEDSDFYGLVKHTTKNMTEQEKIEACKSVACEIAEYIGGTANGNTVTITPEAKMRFLKKRMDNIAIAVEKAVADFKTAKDLSDGFRRPRSVDPMDAFHSNIAEAFKEPFLFVRDFWEAFDAFKIVAYSREKKDLVITVEDIFDLIH